MKDNEYILTVIIPVYNVEKYLNQCVKSVIELNRSDVEIILVDDGSTDRSGVYCDVLTDNYRYIRCIHQINKGLSGARNTGIVNAKGRFVMFLDSDDFIVPEIFQNVIGLLKKYFEVDCFFGDSYYELASDNVLIKGKQNKKIDEGYYCLNDSLKRRLFNTTPILWSAVKSIVKKDFLEKHKIKFNETHIHEDIDWTIKIFLFAEKIYFCKQRWYCYRLEREGSITNTKGLQHIFAYDIMLRNLGPLIKKESPQLCTAFLGRLSGSMMTHLRDYNMLNDKDKEEFKNIYNKNQIWLRYGNKIWHKLFFGVYKVWGFDKAIHIYQIFLKVR